MMMLCTGSIAVASASDGRPAICANSPRNWPGPWVTIS